MRIKRKTDWELYGDEHTLPAATATAAARARVRAQGICQILVHTQPQIEAEYLGARPDRSKMNRAKGHHATAH